MGHQWNLSALFKSREALEAFAESLEKKARRFEKRWSGNLAKAEDFNALVSEYEGLCEGIARVATYCFLLFAKDSKNNGAFYAKYELRANKIQRYLVFFEIEFTNLDSKISARFAKKGAKYQYFLERLLAYKKHQLQKNEEQLLLTMSPIAKDAFSRLFDEYMSSLSFKFGDEKLSEEEILAKLHASDRKARKRAQKTLTKKLTKSSLILKYILNIVRKNVAIQRDLRGFEKAESFRHLDNQITQKSVDSMIAITEKNFPLVHKYYALKGKILGFDLKDYDRYAPIARDEGRFPYENAQAIVIKAYSDFSPLFGNIAKKAFNNGWIDSHPSANKRSGAFSHGATPAAHPFVMLNYTNGRRDVFTIAHELGHAIHQELSKSVGYLNMDTPLTTAETASVFGEMLLFHHLKRDLKDRDLLSLYAGKIEDIFSTLFRQVVMTNFERRIHAQDEELEVKDFNKIWFEENHKMFGDSLKLTKNYYLWWSYIPHFIHSPFYCYAYSYGQLLALALFGLYRSGDEKFVEKYTKFLSLGGSKSPKDLVGIFGFDIEDEKFWECGISEVKAILGEFDALIKGQK